MRKPFKIAAAIVGALFALGLLGSIMNAGEAETATADTLTPQPAAVVAAGNATSEEAVIRALTVEGGRLSSDVADLANDALDAVNAGDVDTVCDLMNEIDPKVNRLSTIIDELDAHSSVDQSKIIELRGLEAQVREGFAPAQGLCS